MKKVSHQKSGLTFIEVLIVIATVALLAGLWLPRLAKGKATNHRINCISQLKQIGLGMRMFSNDHGDKFPWAVAKAEEGSFEYNDSKEVFRHFLTVTNELTRPVVLTCPNDPGRIRTTNWSNLSNTNLSYFVGLDSDESQPLSVLSGDRTLSIDSRVFSGVMTITNNSYPRVLPGVHGSSIGIGLGDGSARQMTESEVRNWLLHTNNPPMRLAVP